MSCLLKFTLTETTGIINTGWLLQGMGELYSNNSDGMHDVFFFNMEIQCTSVYIDGRFI
jgi:hypothetical protein